MIFMGEIKTKLIEFKNKDGAFLRGVLTYCSLNYAKSVVMMGGFERTATTETKFKKLADELALNNICTFRFDHTGVGLSDGDFSKISIESLSNDLNVAIKALKKEIKFKSISFLSHSLPPCVLFKQKFKKIFDKIVIISPALNQKDLLRYWFVVSEMKVKNYKLKITWDNYKKYLNENNFQKYCIKKLKMTKSHYVSKNYFVENQNKDYSLLINDTNNIFHVHGEKDDTVPLESLNIKFKNQYIVKGGDHDIERPDYIKKWLGRVVNFLKN